MQKFSYIIRNKKGDIVHGEVDGESKEDVAKSLLDQGLTPVSIKADSDKSLLQQINMLGGVPAADKILFAEELSTLINAGVPISQSLTMLEKQTENAKLKDAVGGLCKDVDGGLSLSLAMEKYPKVFSPVFVNMVKSGEIGGTLDEALTKLAEQLNKDHELMAKIKGAMTYPAVILVAMVGAMIYMMLTIVPQLAVMFADLGGELPAATKFLIFLSKAMTDYGIISVAVIAAVVYTFRMATIKIFKFRRFLHIVLLKFPVVGNLTRKMNVARFARTLGSLISSGVSVDESLEIVAASTQNIIFKEAVDKCVDKVKNGSNISDVLKASKVFPSLVSQMISVGEDTGSLDVILNKVATFYEREVDNITKNLSTLLEPLMMVVIGLMVGFLIVSIITPIYKLTAMF